MQDRPTVHELLESLGRFLDEEIVPATEGRRQFLARVAANVARLVDRELACEDAQLDDEWRRLRAIPGLLGEGTEPTGREGLRRAIADGTAELAKRIRSGEVDGDGPLRAAMLDHLRRTVRDKLVVSNPAWLEADEGAWGNRAKAPTIVGGPPLAPPESAMHLPFTSPKGGHTQMAAGISEVSDATFEAEVLRSATPVLIDFWAPWCGPCRAIAPVVEELAREYAGKVKIVKMNVDDNPQTPAKYGVRGIPNLIVFKGGQVAEQIVGAVPKARLAKALDSVAVA